MWGDEPLQGALRLTLRLEESSQPGQEGTWAATATEMEAGMHLPEPLRFRGAAHLGHRGLTPALQLEPCHPD